MTKFLPGWRRHLPRGGPREHDADAALRKLRHCGAAEEPHPGDQQLEARVQHRHGRRDEAPLPRLPRPPGGQRELCGAEEG